MATVGALNLFAQISNNAYQALFQGFSWLAGIHGFLLFRHQFPDVAWHGVVQDRLPAFQNGDALITVDRLEISEVDV